MAKYRKRPVVVDAEQWFPGKTVDGVQEYPMPQVEDTVYVPKGLIETLEGPHLVSPGDYIITGVAGEKYPCKPDIFAQTYERVQE